MAGLTPEQTVALFGEIISTFGSWFISVLLFGYFIALPAYRTWMENRKPKEEKKDEVDHSEKMSASCIQRFTAMEAKEDSLETKIDDQTEVLVKLEASVDRLDHAIRGNGRAGLLTRVTVAENNIEHNKDEIKELKGAK